MATDRIGPRRGGGRPLFGVRRESVFSESEPDLVRSRKPDPPLGYPPFPLGETGLGVGVPPERGETGLPRPGAGEGLLPLEACTLRCAGDVLSGRGCFGQFRHSCPASPQAIHNPCWRRRAASFGVRDPPPRPLPPFPAKDTRLGGGAAGLACAEPFPPGAEKVYLRAFAPSSELRPEFEDPVPRGRDRQSAAKWPRFPHR